MERRRMIRMAGLNEERLTMTGSISDTIQSLEFNASQISNINKAIDAVKTLGLKCDIYGIGYGYWVDKDGEALFIHNILLKISGKKFLADIDAKGKLEEVKPSNSSAKISLAIFNK